MDSGDGSHLGVDLNLSQGYCRSALRANCGSKGPEPHPDRRI